MKRFIVSSLLSCLVMGQAFAIFDLCDSLRGNVRRLFPYFGIHDGTQVLRGSGDAGVQTCLAGAGAFYGTRLWQILGHDEVKYPHAVRRNARLAFGAMAAGSLYKGLLMRSVGTSDGIDHYRSIYENDGFLPVPDVVGTKSLLNDPYYTNKHLKPTIDNGTGRVVIGGLALAGLAVTAKRPAMFSRAWTAVRNWFSPQS